MKNRIFIIILIFGFILSSCSAKTNQEKPNKESEIKQDTSNKEKENKDMKLNQIEGFREGNIKATIKTTEGDIKVILFPNVAPKAVENFVKHAKDGYYNGIIFHRVIEDFMIQGGDPTGTGRGGESIYGKPFEDEIDLNYRNFYGALSMANAGPKTNGSQFFIVTLNKIDQGILDQMKEAGEKNGYPDKIIEAYKQLGGAFWLDGKHTVFGHVVDGMDVAVKISKVEKDANDKPKKDVKIVSITVE